MYSKKIDKYIVKDVRIDSNRGIQFIKLDNDKILELTKCWYNSLIDVGDCIGIKLYKSINETSSFDQTNVISIDDKNGYIVLQPDHLITITDLCASYFCDRKTWLNSRFKPTGTGNEAFLIGSLVHCLFQETINEQKIDRIQLYDGLKSLIKHPSILKGLLEIEMDEEEILNKAKNYIDSVILFKEKYNSGSSTQFDKNRPNLKLKINKIIDIEDTVIAPELGLKGKIDVTMDVEIYDDQEKRKQKSTPLELKTGRIAAWSIGHQTQVSCYSMMKNDCDFGILCYLKDGIDMRFIEINDHKKRDLIIQRNQLVHYLKFLEKGPDLKENIRFCENCEHFLDCCLIGEIYESREKLSKFINNQPNLVEKALGHLNGKDFEFFENWTNMIYIEEKHTKNELNYNAFWNFDVIDLESKEKAIAKLSIFKANDELNEYVFVRSSLHKNLGPFPHQIQFLQNSDRIVLSIENDSGELIKIGFVGGCIKSIDERYVVVRLDEKIKDELKDKLFRLDIVSLIQNFSQMYSSILRLMKSDEINSKVLRDLIINKRKPTFNTPIPQNQLGLINRSCESLNFYQQKSILQAFKMDDFLLIKGNPGSGKTETIVHLVKLFAELNRTVLITAHTNQAVDNILLKLLKHNVKFMRIGNSSRINQEILCHSEDQLIKNCTSTLELQKIYSSFNVFAATCISIQTHLIFKSRNIEYCIVDEASQISLPENLLPLLSSKKFILVGDPYQLPPIVRSTDAKKSGFDQTLFDLLFDEDCYVDLKIQYRMNSEIMRIANECTYDNQLICGSQEIENATLKLSKTSSIFSDLDCDKMEDENSSCESYIDKCLSEKIDMSVVFIDTDGKQTETEHQVDKDGDINNSLEMKIISEILNHLLIEKGFNENEIGIITPYQNQVKCLKAFTAFFNVKVSTIDQFQGKFFFH